jgi:ABC-type glutathione transport system ATPase component
MPLLAVEGLVKHFPLGGPGEWLDRVRGRAPKAVRAVDGVSFAVEPGETLGLVGESGCGKSTVARMILRLVDPTGGHVRFGDVNLTALTGEPLRRQRRDLQMVFQDPTASLNPRLSVRRAVEEPLRRHSTLGAGERRERVAQVLARVGLGRELLDRYPHELSGGQRQRVNTARAIATEPRFVVLDEPTSALDVSLRAKAILLLAELRATLGMSYLFISHDLATVKYLAGRVAVMYLGTIVEEASTAELFGSRATPLHEGAPVGRPDSRPHDPARAHGAEGRGPEPHRHPRRLPTARALSARAAGLRRARDPAGGGAAASRRLPSRLIRERRPTVWEK